MEKIGVIGAGSWGTALAQTIAGKGYDVHIYDVNREHLDETLLGRVGNVSGCSCVRSRTNAGFVGIKASLYPKHQTGSADAAQDFLEVEGIGKDSA